MRSTFTQISLFFLLLVGLQVHAQDIKWLSWEEAVKLSETDAKPKKMFIDVYTDWCGWCKKMDKDTFQHPEVSKYMQANFYMVKLDAEGKAPIEYKGKTFKFVPSGRNGYHELAAALLQGQLSYPTVVFLDEEMNMLSPVPGYQKVEPFMQIAKYFGENIYKDKDWQTYAGK
ncbi:MAG: DUF255 domain-containing protein [Bacteroidota bacterium]|nr:DUF255 domain-containing protein [Bacteroidota bacterium]